MQIRTHNKSTPKDIREKFDHEVHKYGNLDHGQVSAMDSVLIMDTVAEYAGAVQSGAKELLDIGCGAGNYTIKTLAFMPAVNCTLVDLSGNMLKKAEERISKETSGTITPLLGDIREIDLPDEKYDVVIAATSLHHLREEVEWEHVFHKIYKAMAPGGVFLISDLVIHDHPTINEAAWKYYWDYLLEAGGEELKKWVYEQIDIEDSPRSLNFQMDMMRKFGFSFVEVLYRKSVFAAICGVK